MAQYDESLPDRIYETFYNKTVFITGGSGFLGRAIIERLLRTFEIKKVYILIRPKKGKDVQSRLEAIFSTVVSETKNINQNLSSISKTSLVSYMIRFGHSKGTPFLRNANQS